MKKIANSIHHTHWDLIWYFTTQDATVQLTYNMKELLKGFREGKINNFYFDGQTTPFDEYLALYPEAEAEIKELVSTGKLVIGPFNSQLDSFISSGESVINNLKLGFRTGDKLGKTSRIAYLPDSFGHSIDFPKIFNKFGIHEFVIKRGVGDEYDLNSEFHWKSKDGSELLVFTMIAGYGYGCYAFKEKTLFTDDAVDYNKIRVDDLIERINSYSSLENDFVFLLGFDQNPAIMNVDELIEYHNNNQDKYEFVEVTWEAYFNKIRESGVELKTHHHELFSTQYHRVHRTIFSARADIKAMQDEVERVLTYQVQPYMAMLDALGIPYEEKLVYKAWETLVLCQTHSSANLTNETNEFIKVQTNNALNLANSMVSYLNKLLCISLDDFDSDYTSLLISNTLPYAKDLTFETKIFTKERTFSLYNQANQKLDYTILKTVKENNGVLRKDTLKINEDKFYYVHDVVCHLHDFPAMSYEVIKVVEDNQDSQVFASVSYDRFIENAYYKIYQDEDGITLVDKIRNKQIKQVIYLEDGGDEGDSFDYSYPNKDLILMDNFSDAKVEYTDNTYRQVMTITGNFAIPQNLSERKNKQYGTHLDYEIKLILDKDDNMIKLKGSINNDALQHRVRLVFKGDDVDKEHSYAGTQFDYIKRETNPEALKFWKEEGWFEEPSANFPLLNHVSSVGDVSLNVYTRSSKEYELIGERFSDIAVVLFRSYGALGYPDLNRRPGRPGGLDYMVFETSDSQMIGKNSFELAFNYTDAFDANVIRNMYINYAADPIVHHQQNFDKSINAIQYFPTNPLEIKLPLKHQFISLEDFEGSYGTLLKEKDYYVLRVYNNQEKEISLKIKLPESMNWEVSEIDLLGNKVSDDTNTLKANELKIIKIKEV